MIYVWSDLSLPPAPALEARSFFGSSLEVEVSTAQSSACEGSLSARAASRCRPSVGHSRRPLATRSAGCKRDTDSLDGFSPPFSQILFRSFRLQNLQYFFKHILDIVFLKSFSSSRRRITREYFRACFFLFSSRFPCDC